MTMRAGASDAGGMFAKLRSSKLLRGIPFKLHVITLWYVYFSIVFIIQLVIPVGLREIPKKVALL